MWNIFKTHKKSIPMIILLTVLIRVATVFIAWIDVAWVNFAMGETALRISTIIIATIIIIFVYLVITQAHGAVFFTYQSKVMTNLKSSLMETLLKFKSGIYELSNSEIISVFTNDFFQLNARVLRSGYFAGEGVLSFIFASVVLAVIDIRLFIVVLIITCFPLVICSKLQKRSQAMQVKVSAGNGALTEEVKEIIGGQTSIRSYLAQERFIKSFENKSHQLETVKKKVHNMDALVVEVTGFFAQSLFFSVLFVCAWLVSAGQITVGIILLAVYFSASIGQALDLALPSIHNLKSAKPIAEKIMSMIKDRKEYTGEDVGSTIGNINLKNVTVKYGEKTALDSFSFFFHPGKKYLIKGPSGSGKTTLLHLLSKRAEHYSGSIEINDKQLADIDFLKWNKRVSYITQNVFTLNASALENVVFKSQFSNAEIDAAVTDASLSGVNLDKHISELSGGEKQRVAIARALLRKSEVLLIDEINAELDNITSKEILNTVLALEKTVICVLHRYDDEILNMFDEVIDMSD